MYVYIYDSFLNEKSYDRVLSRIETRNTDLGINGNIIRLGMIRNIADIVENEIKKGAKTIVAVGNNETFNKLVNVFVKLKEKGIHYKTPLGFIPVGNNNEIAFGFGIEREEAACNILSGRKIEILSINKANDKSFVSIARIPAKGTTIKFDDDYLIEPIQDGWVEIVNETMNYSDDGNEEIKKESSLKLYIKPEQKRLSRNKDTISEIPINQITIYNDHKNLELDFSEQIKTPVIIKQSDTQITLITGKQKIPQ